MKKFIGWAVTIFALRVLLLAGALTLFGFLQDREYHYSQPHIFEFFRFITGLLFLALWTMAGYKLGSLEGGRFFKGALVFGVLVEIPTILNYFLNHGALAAGFFPYAQILQELNIDFALAFFLFLALFIGSYLMAAARAFKNGIYLAVVSVLSIFTVLFFMDLVPRVVTLHKDQVQVEEMILEFHQLVAAGEYREASAYTHLLKPAEIEEYWANITFEEEEARVERIVLEPARRYYMLPGGDGDKYARRYLLKAHYLWGSGQERTGHLYIEIKDLGARIVLLKVL